MIKRRTRSIAFNPNLCLSPRKRSVPRKARLAAKVRSLQADMEGILSSREDEIRAEVSVELEKQMAMFVRAHQKQQPQLLLHLQRVQLLWEQYEARVESLIKQSLSKVGIEMNRLRSDY
jgi:hypothetical protein